MTMPQAYPLSSAPHQPPAAKKRLKTQAAIEKFRAERREQLKTQKENVARLQAEWMEREIERRAALTDEQRNRSYKSRAATAKARALKYGCEGVHIGDDIKALLLAQKGLCAGCSEDMQDVYHVDHIQELSDGGSNNPSNLQLLCIPCNLKKGGRHRKTTVRRKVWARRECLPVQRGLL